MFFDSLPPQGEIAGHANVHLWFVSLRRSASSLVGGWIGVRLLLLLLLLMLLLLPVADATGSGRLAGRPEATAGRAALAAPRRRLPVQPELLAVVEAARNGIRTNCMHTALLSLT